jgi:hypothetical protein
MGKGLYEGRYIIMGKKEVTTGVTSVEIEFADNGYVISYRGESSDGDWAEAKLICKDLAEVGQLMQKIKTELA